MDRVTWTPTPDEVAAVVLGTTFVVLRRSFAVLGAVCIVLALVYLLLAGPGAAVIGVGAVLVVLVPFFFLVTYRRNARVIRAAYPVGVEACAEASDEGLRLVSAVADVQLPWGRLGRPRVGRSVVAFRDTLTR